MDPRQPFIERGPDRRLSQVQPSQMVENVADLLERLPMAPGSTDLIERRTQIRRTDYLRPAVAFTQTSVVVTLVLLTSVLFGLGFIAGEGHRQIQIKNSVRDITHPQQAIYRWIGYHREASQ